MTAKTLCITRPTSQPFTKRTMKSEDGKRRDKYEAQLAPYCYDALQSGHNPQNGKEMHLNMRTCRHLVGLVFLKKIVWLHVIPSFTNQNFLPCSIFWEQKTKTKKDFSAQLCSLRAFNCRYHCMHHCHVQLDSIRGTGFSPPES